MRCFFCGILCLAAGLAAGIYAGSEERSGPGETIIGGYGFWEFGQIEKGAGDQIDHVWMNHALLGLRLEKQALDYLKIVISPEFKLYYPFPEKPNSPATVRPNSTAFINEMFGSFSYRGPENPLFSCDIGIFNYKYNPQSRDLGEYLFRTGTLPTFVITDFDFPAAKLMGVKLSTRAVKNLTADLLLTSEWHYYPLYDFSVTGVAGYTCCNAITLGAGFQLARILPVKPERTSPDASSGALVPLWDAARYITNKGDTAFYSFQVPKFMGRMTIDPKVLFPSIHLFGAEDLKLYGEATLIGLNYNARTDTTTDEFGYYNDIFRRLPVMAGFNIPAFKLLDVLSAEVEYFPIGYPNDYRRLYQFVPLPYIDAPAGKDYNPDDYSDLNIRWAFYARRSFANSFVLSGQIAYDHFRTTYNDGSTTSEECLTKKGNWYWIAKIAFLF